MYAVKSDSESSEEEEQEETKPELGVTIEKTESVKAPSSKSTPVKIKTPVKIVKKEKTPPLKVVEIKVNPEVKK